jgi:hypothetical protein
VLLRVKLLCGTHLRQLLSTAAYSSRSTKTPCRKQRKNERRLPVGLLVRFSYRMLQGQCNRNA